MKLRCEILAVESRGLNLGVKVQGKQANGADWRDINAFTIEIPSHERTAKAFYVGRIITIEVMP